MSKLIKELFGDLYEQVREHMGGKEWFLTVGMLTLIVVWLYFGSPQSFMKMAVGMGPDPLLDWYQYLFYHVNALLLIGILPLLILRKCFHMNLRSLGIQLGDWRFGVRLLPVAFLLVTPCVFLASLDPQFQSEYPLTKLASRSWQTWILWELTYLIYYLGWESCFRGVLLFGLRDRLGTAGALAFQTAISTLVHLGADHTKPFWETMSAIPGGFLLGVVALRTRSVLWPLLIHWFVGVSTDVLAYIQVAQATP